MDVSQFLQWRYLLQRQLPLFGDDMPSPAYEKNVCPVVILYYVRGWTCQIHADMICEYKRSALILLRDRLQHIFGTFVINFTGTQEPVA